MKRSPRISRRLMLGGGATLLGLPFLESALPRAARAAGATAPVRLVYIFLPNGLDMATFRPAIVARTTPCRQCSGPRRAQARFLDRHGTGDVNAKPDGAGGHAAGTCGFITCAHANKSQTDLKLGIRPTRSPHKSWAPPPAYPHFSSVSTAAAAPAIATAATVAPTRATSRASRTPSRRCPRSSIRRKPSTNSSKAMIRTLGRGNHQAQAL